MQKRGVPDLNLLYSIIFFRPGTGTLGPLLAKLLDLLSVFTMKNSWFWLERVFESKSRFDAFNRKESDLKYGLRCIRAFEIFNYFKSSFADPIRMFLGRPDPDTSIMKKK